RGGAQQGARVVVAGALQVFTANPRKTAYKRAAGALQVFTANPRKTTYKRSAGALQAFIVESAITYKHPPATPPFHV
ncbi:hypothetical protein, partial [Halorubrum sp. DTA98]|uniref:hypothetical protein n=1 Tax=Halorubrum sp. DTA98 TaxID=3402163 RepID=UPI003AAE639D